MLLWPILQESCESHLINILVSAAVLAKYHNQEIVSAKEFNFVKRYYQ